MRNHLVGKISLLKRFFPVSCFERLSCHICIFQLERFCLMATSRASLGLIPFCTSISAFKVNKWTLNKNTMTTILIFVIVVSDQWGRCSRSQRRSWAQSVREGRRSRCWTGWDVWGVGLEGASHVKMWKLMFFIMKISVWSTGKLFANWLQIYVFKNGKISRRLWLWHFFQSNQIWKHNCLSKWEITNT